jgi:hypothetical protein
VIAGAARLPKSEANSREAAKECSPRRKQWGTLEKTQSQDKIASRVRQVSFAPSELADSLACFPTACAVGCILAPLRG